MHIYKNISIKHYKNKIFDQLNGTKFYKKKNKTNKQKNPITQRLLPFWKKTTFLEKILLFKELI